VLLENKTFYASNSWLIMPNPKLGAKIQLLYSEVRYLQKSSVERPYVTAGVVIAPLPPTELGMRVETAGE
jgi:hypothetical protein